MSAAISVNHQPQPEVDGELLQVGGFVPLTTIDYPDQLAAVVFCQGCPWRCRYCHNPDLLPRQGEAGHRWSELLDKLSRRAGLLDAVVFSGGEPTLQSGLAQAISQVRELGLKVGLHTAGSYPQRLEKLLPLLDWVGLDIKALIDDYPFTTGVPGSGERAWQSLRLLLASKVTLQVRITVHPQLLPEAKLQTLLEKLADHGIWEPQIQPCRTEKMLDEKLSKIIVQHKPVGV